MTVTPLTSKNASKLFEEALDWIVCLKAGAPTQADADALKLWRRQSPEHEAALRTAVKAFRQGQAALEYRQFEHQDIGHRTSYFGRTRHRVVASGALAAVAGSLVVWPPLDPLSSFKESASEQRTQKGEKRFAAVNPGLPVELSSTTETYLHKPKSRT